MSSQKYPLILQIHISVVNRLLSQKSVKTMVTLPIKMLLVVAAIFSLIVPSIAAVPRCFTNSDCYNVYSGLRKRKSVACFGARPGANKRGKCLCIDSSLSLINGVCRTRAVTAPIVVPVPTPVIVPGTLLICLWEAAFKH